MNVLVTIPQPARAKESSPRIHPWVVGRVGKESRQGQKRMSVVTGFFRPSVAWGILGRVNPAMNRWAIFGCLCGTGADGGAPP
jgi:hypothetical protein